MGISTPKNNYAKVASLVSSYRKNPKNRYQEGRYITRRQMRLHVYGRFYRNSNMRRRPKFDNYLSKRKFKTFILK